MTKIKLLFATLLIGIISLTIAPATQTFAAVDTEQRIYDAADLLTDSQEAELKALSESLKATTNMDIIMVTTNNSEGKSSMAYADDFYDYNGFSEDGILMLIDMDNREVWISTSGLGIRYLTDARIDTMLDNIFAYMPNDYHMAGKTFFNDVEHYYQLGIPSNQYNQDEEGNIDPYYPAEVKTFGGQLLKTLTMSPVFLIIAAGFGALVAFIASRRKNARVTTNSSTYANGDLQFQIQQDTFINSHTSQTYIPPASSSRSSGSSGRSSTHSSSSGRSHGGGGRKF
ncbi:TPM domain-containing protein [Culicoidibacter larvae]|uniref:TPM domain-containing protein n=1 Tax=Culicoidibacter larvae TaxID=2579976 RepID=A0A5R8Q800_9FIRM|nr:TPM domain-containing protein [Culicoidibacter larvae]TLG71225.1 hypothetical protein FEZ08_11260 [Culicoidibacter larvae]